MAAAEEYARRHDLDLDDTLSFQDIGVSAYRGRNVEIGRLGEFLRAVESGVVPEGSMLLVENLDRISRQSALRAINTLGAIVESGVIVVTLSDGRSYTAKTLDEDPLALTLALFTFMRAHEESLIKGRRIRAAWENKRNRAVAEGTPLTKLTPGWLVLGANGKLRLEPKRAAIVKRIFKMTLAGVGQHAIAESLNREKVKPFRSKVWHRSYVKKILENPAAMGTLVAHRIEHEKGKKVRKPAMEVPNHFPAVVSETDWKRVASMREGNAAAARARSPKGPAALQNILAGLARCPTCGGTMTRVSKGPTGGYAYLTCAKAKQGAGCKYRNIKMENVETAVLRNIDGVLGGMPTGDAETDKRLNEIEVSLGVLQDNASNVAAAIAARGTTGVLGAQLDTIEAQMAELEAEQRQLIAANEDAPLLDLKVSELEKEVARPAPDRGRVNALLRQMVRAVVVDHTNGRLVFQWRHGGESHVVFAMPRPD